MGEKETKQKTTVGCPYCTREIPFDAAQCPYCGTSFGSQTIRILRSFVDEALFKNTDERRSVDRVPQRLKIVYSAANMLVTSYLSNIGVGGVFIPAENPMPIGSRFDLKISLPDGEKDLDVRCEVVWMRKKNEKTVTGKIAPGMGVKFLNLPPEDKQRIERIIKSLPPRQR